MFHDKQTHKKMARTTNEIFEAILTEKANEPALSQLTNNSQTSRWRLFAYVVAKFHNLMELLFDKHKSEVTQVVDVERWGRLGWYVKKALLYQHGRSLIGETDGYNNSSLTDAAIELERVVKYASATENDEGKVVVKVAKGEVPDLEPLTDQELSGLHGYFLKIRPAGIRVITVSQPADSLKLIIKIAYDALILDAEGKRLDGTNNTPVIEAINNYLSNIEFSGEYSNMAMTDAIQRVEGCTIVDLRAAFYKYSSFDYYSEIVSRYRPDAGYMKFINADSLIEYVPYD